MLIRKIFDRLLLNQMYFHTVNDINISLSSLIANFYLLILDFAYTSDSKENYTRNAP